MYKLDTIVFKNRPYLFWISLPLIIVISLLSAIFYFNFLDSGNDGYALFRFTIFISIEMRLLIGLISRFRYIPAGQFQFDKDYFIYDGTKNQWKNLKIIEIFYRGDFWYSKFKLFQKYKAYERYSHLNYRGTEAQEEKLIDKIIIDSKKVILFKVRNQKEKDYFFKIIEFANLNNVSVFERTADFF